MSLNSSTPRHRASTSKMNKRKLSNETHEVNEGEYHLKIPLRSASDLITQREFRNVDPLSARMSLLNPSSPRPVAATFGDLGFPSAMESPTNGPKLHSCSSCVSVPALNASSPSPRNVNEQELSETRALLDQSVELGMQLTERVRELAATIDFLNQDLESHSQELRCIHNSYAQRQAELENEIRALRLYEFSYASAQRELGELAKELQHEKELRQQSEKRCNELLTTNFFRSMQADSVRDALKVHTMTSDLSLEEISAIRREYFQAWREYQKSCKLDRLLTRDTTQQTSFVEAPNHPLQHYHSTQFSICPNLLQSSGPLSPLAKNRDDDEGVEMKLLQTRDVLHKALSTLRKVQQKQTFFEPNRRQASTGF